MARDILGFCLSGKERRGEKGFISPWGELDKDKISVFT